MNSQFLTTWLQQQRRRHFLTQCSSGLGAIALSGLMSDQTAADTTSTDLLAVRRPHFDPRAKAVIHLFMAGAPSQLEMFDNKPLLTELTGKPLPPSVIGGQRYAFIQPDAAVMGPQFDFAKHGECGAEISSAMPHLSSIVDDICLVRSMHTDQFNHAPAQIFMNTGFSQPGRPSLGSWLLYGLGSETRDLPSFARWCARHREPYTCCGEEMWTYPCVRPSRHCPRCSPAAGRCRWRSSDGQHSPVGSPRRRIHSRHACW